ncbi:hypothetical protein BC834DRAFT_307285 [Gloeopeniophorella convolvens]|nr:hypothetical protein BC834DRAFT_307285 [Gloeopeniophorella convolvens]
MAEYETSAAILETETSTPELAREVHNRAGQAQVAAKEAALIAETQSFPPDGTVPAGDTTSAARAEAVQSTPAAAHEVHETAQHAKGVAENAASAAHNRGPGATGNLSDVVPQFATKVRATTDAAVEEGQRDVQAAANTGAGYLEQAKNLASSAIATATAYLPASVSGTNPNPSTTTQSPASTNTASTINTAKQYAASAQVAAQPALETAKQYASSAAQAAQPHVEAAGASVRSGVNYAVESAQGYFANGSTTVNGSAGPAKGGVPASSAALESGQHIVGNPYPPASGPHAQQIAVNESK